MIKLTRLNRNEIVVNSDLIEHIEITPDTVLTLINGEKLVVTEPVDAVIERIVAFKRRILSGLEVANQAAGSVAFRPYLVKADTERMKDEG